ncbi:MAG: lamin tail domain-containing protein, partial [Phycisphaerae bacterium]|nr:lamin tail domain-containing protein [Phycisphaerae bacterium]
MSGKGEKLKNKTGIVAVLIALIVKVGPAAMLVGDFNQDNAVTYGDLSILAAQWLTQGPACSEVGLIAHWKLDENIEAAAADASGFGRHGVVHGEFLWHPEDGRIGGSLEFDGFEDYIDIPGFKGVSGNAPRTCAAWIRTPEVNGEIISWGLDVTGGRWNVVVEPAGLLRVEVGAGFVIGSTFLADNQWHHVTVVSDGKTTDAIRLYVDGRRDTFSAFLSQSINTSAANDVRIGAFPGRVRYFTGNLDDIRIYDRALTEAEVWTLATTNTTDPACPDIDLEEGVAFGDFALLAANWNRRVPPLLINEILADNKSILSTRVNGVVEFPDWIELYNPSSAAVNLTGWYLTDNAKDLTKWAFPAGLTLSPGEYLVVFASGKTQAGSPDNYPFLDDDGSWHTNFKLTTDGEYLALVAGSPPAIVHAYDTHNLGNGEFGFPPQREDISYGVQNDALHYFAVPTPGQANASGFIGFADTPDFSRAAGFYDDPVRLILTCDTPDAIIRYTTNGSEPTQTGNGSIYTAPITISTTTCVRARAFRAGYRPSKTRTASYLLNAGDAIKSLPTISIVGDEQQSLFEPQGIMAIVGGYYNNGVWTASGAGDYNYPTRRGSAYERPVSVEILHADGKGNTQIDCGIRVAGSDWHRPRYTRGENWSGNYNKFSFKLFFRGSYGDSRFDYPMFDLFPIDSFKALMLRGGHNDVNNPFIKDEWVRRLHKDMGGVAASGTLMNLFLNGKYKAYYNPTERLDDDFFRAWYDSDADWDVITQRAVRNGDSVDFNNMRNFVRNNSMADDTNYRRASEWIDINDFIDYLIIQLYCANWDWPQNNWTAARERTANAKWRFYLWDVEGSLEAGHVGTVRLGELNSGGDPSSQLYRSLKASPDFRQAFADRIQKHFFADGALTRHNLEMRFHQLRNEMSQVLPGMNQSILTYWIPGRHSVMMNAFITEGLFGPEGPVFNIDGQPVRTGYVRDGAVLTMTKPGGSGTIWYTTDGVDPRRPVTPDQTTTILVPESASKRVFVPNTDLSTTWTGGNEPYNDSAWTHGTPPTPRPLAGVGYERSSGYEDRISYNVENRLYGNATRSALIRIPFTVTPEALAGYNMLTLRMRYDDGFAAYINGRLVHQQYITGTPGSGATVASHEDYGQESFDISQHVGALKPGNNILAIHGMNASANSSDFIILPELLAGRTTTGGGGIAETAASYVGPISLEKTARVKARVLNGGVWSALSEAVYTVGAVHNVRISEIMYHPADPNGTDTRGEFVELANAGDQPINLNMVEFTRGIRFAFDDVSLEPGERVLVVEDEAAFRNAYPDSAATIAGTFSGKLDNAGENLALVDGLGRTIAAFSYDDKWFDLTDGGGFSLTLRQKAERLAHGIKAHYKLDESTGLAAGDSSGYGRNGFIKGKPYWLPFNGKTDGALQLNGEGDYVEITNYKGVLGSGPRTCAAWIKTTGQNVAIAGWGMVDPTGTRWAMVVDAAGRLRQEFGGGYVLGTKVINDGKWHHVAVVLEGPRSDDAVLYVDGYRETISEMVSLSVNTQAGPNAAIGAHLGMNRYFNGLLDNFCIYERALSAEEVSLLAASADYWEDKQYWRPSAHVGGSPGEDDTGIVPEPGAVVINELLAHSHAAQPDWVELHNTTGEAIDIGGWFLSDSKNDYMKFRIADNTILAPYGYAVFYESLHFNNTQNPGCL